MGTTKDRPTALLFLVSLLCVTGASGFLVPSANSNHRLLLPRVWEAVNSRDTDDADKISPLPIVVDTNPPGSMIERLQDEANPCCTKKTTQKIKFSQVNVLLVSVLAVIIGGYLTLGDVLASR